MLSAAAHLPGNGEHEWNALADQAKEHSTTVRDHARKVGPEQGPGEGLVTRLHAADDFLGEVLILVDHVRARVDQELASEAEPILADVAGLNTPLETLGESLEKLSESIETAQDAIFKYAAALDNELHQRAAEGEPGTFRPNQQYADDQEVLRKLSKALVKTLVNLAGHLDGLESSLPNLRSP